MSKPPTPESIWHWIMHQKKIELVPWNKDPIDLARQEGKREVLDQLEKFMRSTMTIQLKQTCGACPEQYDVYLNGEKIGYLRLRHGYFRAEFLGQIVYEATPNGDGSFEWDERVEHLNNACNAILKAHNKEPIYEVI